MRSVTDLIDPELLAQTPPRALPPRTVLALIGERLSAVALRVLLDPLLIAGVGCMVILVGLGWPAGALLLALALLLRTWLRWRATLRAIREEIMLLRHGRVLRAYVLKVQAVQTLSGEVDGVCLDCAIPLSPRRTHIGTVWLADTTAAMELARRGQAQVLVLPQTPGSWRLLEGGHSRSVSGFGGLVGASPPVTHTSTNGDAPVGAGTQRHQP